VAISLCKFSAVGKLLKKSFLSENFGLFVAQKEHHIWGQLTAKFVGKMRLSVGILSEISSVSEDCNFLPAYVFLVHDAVGPSNYKCCWSHRHRPTPVWIRAWLELGRRDWSWLYLPYRSSQMLNPTLVTCSLVAMSVKRSLRRMGVHLSTSPFCFAPWVLTELIYCSTQLQRLTHTAMMKVYADILQGLDLQTLMNSFVSKTPEGIAVFGK